MKHILFYWYIYKIFGLLQMYPKPQTYEYIRTYGMYVLYLAAILKMIYSLITILELSIEEITIGNCKYFILVLNLSYFIRKGQIFVYFFSMLRITGHDCVSLAYLYLLFSRRYFSTPLQYYYNTLTRSFLFCATLKKIV